VHRKKPSRALHHFFEAQVRSQLSVIENVFVQRTCPSKKRGRLLPRDKGYCYLGLTKKKWVAHD
jgi:hypothetical protein